MGEHAQKARPVAILKGETFDSKKCFELKVHDVCDRIISSHTITATRARAKARAHASRIERRIRAQTRALSRAHRVRTSSEGDGGAPPGVLPHSGEPPGGEPSRTLRTVRWHGSIKLRKYVKANYSFLLSEISGESSGDAGGGSGTAPPNSLGAIGSGREEGSSEY